MPPSPTSSGPSIWARLRAVGLPADIGTEHYARGEVIALGVRGIAVIGAVIAIAFAVLYALILFITYALALCLRFETPTVPRRTPSRASTVAATLRHHNVLDASAEGVKRVGLGWFRLLGLVATVAVVRAAFESGMNSLAA